jgi:GH15 family glucan-1,4-alpha-glucosidase
MTRIADYALIGDTRTAALTSRDGSIDWMCIPRFDSEPIFGRLVGGDDAGSFRISPVKSVDIHRNYRRDSAILETHWSNEDGAVTLTDGLVAKTTGAFRPEGVLVRRLTCTAGEMTLHVAFDPRLGLPGRPPTRIRNASPVICSWGSTAIALVNSRALDIHPGSETRVHLRTGDDLTFALLIADGIPLVIMSADAAADALEESDRWWRAWAEEITLGGRWRDTVVRSLITLRLLTYAPSGAPVAAPTTSLPEVAGGERNWDYRFSWPRDAAIGVGAFLAAGKKAEARSFLHWLHHTSRLSRPRLSVLYTVFGKTVPAEVDVVGAPGYLASRPVRFGNSATLQHQLDVYGWVVDAAYLYESNAGILDRTTWRAVRSFVDFVARHWREPDAGIWEVRGEKRQYVHSKVMAWVALDRGLRMLQERRDARRLSAWSRARDDLAAEIKKEGFDAARGSYVWHYGSHELDAALLILPILEFDDDARVERTVSAIATELDAGGGSVYRYRPGIDGLAGEEGAFLPCSFWLVQALARSGRTIDAEALFDRLLAFGNDVGLLSEEVDAQSGELLGNFPQAFTHATLVQAAVALSERGAGSVAA